MVAGFPGGSVVKNPPANPGDMQVTLVWSLGREDFLEKEMATHSSILVWRIPWTEEPGGLQSMGLQRVGHDWAHTQSNFLMPQECCIVNHYKKFVLSRICFFYLMYIRYISLLILVGLLASINSIHLDWAWMGSSMSAGHLLLSEQVRVIWSWVAFAGWPGEPGSAPYLPCPQEGWHRHLFPGKVEEPGSKWEHTGFL